ncbi:MAG: heavy metal translocating P-type ATPase metal-binding domain-containing protein, partial [Arenimonas sp.]
MDVLAGPACYHCGETIPAGRSDQHTAMVDGKAQVFCCSGCAAAARWIGKAALSDYYHFRSQNAGRVGTEALDYSAWDSNSVLAEHSREAPGGREITVLTDAMRCAACAWLIDRA